MKSLILQKDPGLIGYWPLDGRSRDVSGSGFHGTDTSILYNTANGMNVPVASFVPTAHIRMGDVCDMGSNEMTVSFWMYLNAYPGSNSFFGLVTKSKASVAAGRWAVMFESYSGTANRAINIISANASGGGTATSRIGINIIAIKKWYHITIRFRRPASGFMQGDLYINGNFIGSVALDAEYNVNQNSASQLAFGIYHSSSDTPTLFPFNGFLSQVRIYNRLLSMGEITNLYIGSLPTVGYHISDYKILGVNNVDIQKSLAYRVLSAHSTTKGLKYTIVKKIGVTKDLSYKVQAKHQITKGLSYKVQAKIAVTKALKYTVATNVSISKGLGYNIIKANSVTKGLKYAITTNVDVSKSLKYSIIKINEETKTLKYAVISEQAITNDLRYRVKKSVGLTLGMSYAIIGAPVKIDIQKSLGYKVNTNHEISQVASYTVVVEHEITKSASYKIVKKKGEIKQLNYKIIAKVDKTKSLLYRVLHIVSITKGLGYRLASTKYDITKALTYKIFLKHGKTKVLAYKIIKANDITKQLQYSIYPYRTITKGLEYRLLVKNGIALNLSYVIRIYPYADKNSPYRSKYGVYADKNSPYGGFPKVN